MLNNACSDSYLIEIVFTYVADTWYKNDVIWIWNQVIMHFWIEQTSFCCKIVNMWEKNIQMRKREKKWEVGDWVGVKEWKKSF